MNCKNSLVNCKISCKVLKWSELVSYRSEELIACQSMLSYSYTVRFIGYDSIQTRRFISYRFQNRGDKSQRVIVAFDDKIENRIH